MAYNGRPGQSNRYDYGVVVDWLAAEDLRQAGRRRSDSEVIDWQEARTREMAARAVKSELETEQVAGSLGDRRAMRLEVEDLGRRAVDKLLTISDRVAAIIAEMTDETAIAAVIDGEVRKVAEEIARLVDDLAGEGRAE